MTKAQYGEFASPEEQARARGESVGDAEKDGNPGSPTVHLQARQHPGGPHLMQPEPPSAVTTSASRQPRPFDRMITVALLAFGLVTVIVGFPQYLDLGAIMSAAYEQAGVGEFGAHEAAHSGGKFAAGLLLAAWVASALGSFFAMRARRLSWWIPLVGAAVTLVGLFLIVVVVMSSDPGLMTQLSPIETLR